MSLHGTRARIDWAAAREFFVAMEKPRSFVIVARHFGVSDTAVRNHAKPGADLEEGWEAYAAAVDKRVGEKLAAQSERTVADRQRQLLRIYDRAAQLVEDAINPDSPQLTSEQVFAKFPELHRMMRLETEQATDHVALAEVQAGFRAAMRVALETALTVAAEQLGDRKAREFVGRYRELFLPAVNEALAIASTSDVDDRGQGFA